MGIDEIERLEQSNTYLIQWIDPKRAKRSPTELQDLLLDGMRLLPNIFDLFADKMTQREYEKGEAPFDGATRRREPYRTVDLGVDGAIEKVNEALGLGFDTEDVFFYRDLFQKKLGRNPTDVELFDLASHYRVHTLPSLLTN